MISFKIGNLLDNIEIENLNGIMNAANAVGVMGAGIAGAIRKYGGRTIQDDAIRVCKLEEPHIGDAYSTVSGMLLPEGIKRIIHAVTMEKPGGMTTYVIIQKAFKSALIKAKEEGITKIGCTALGTGVGGLNPITVAKFMYNVAKEFDIDILFMDFNKQFIYEINENLKCK